ncbi:efflux RND transporter periplasmic adaptor subunit [Amaricoccus sp.]|uniref:efflux RND transporter periplasmic adaptor subunit n=1 Tax=Amaricoccus sp. TaxID=1872485 RepID=UPI001B3FF59A|nr:efflux RND transporter periplasmic adaptor subunit [Amaricoccus sp.]MBP7001772.1 efflux RND transporter periplasmic adaptor subunit [Amaricoccus sp.]
MHLGKQLALALAIVAAAVVGWAWWMPEAVPLLARLGLPTRAAAPAPEGGAGGFGRGAAGGPVLVAGAPVGEGRANARVSAIGDGQALRSVAVKPLDSGRLVAIEVAAGAVVAPGDPVARLDSDLEEIALERASLLAEDAEATYARVARLRGNGAATDVQEREARLALERARLEQRDAAVALDRRAILAPIAGIVGLLPLQVGAQVDTGDEIATIEDRSSLLVEFRVPERVVGLLDIGAEVTATPLARPDLILTGRVTALDNRIDPTSRTLRVQAALPNEDDRLRSGMAFSIDIRLDGDPFPEVDALAVQWDGDGAYVWVGRDARAVRIPVRVVQRGGETALVAGALAPGERVVTDGVQRLREGAALRFVGDPEPPRPVDPKPPGPGEAKPPRPGEAEAAAAPAASGG